MSTPQTAEPTTRIEDRIGQRGVWWPTDAMPAADAAEFAAWLESLGYGALWIPETLGRDPFAHVCLQPLKPAGRMGEPDRDALEALAPR